MSDYARTITHHTPLSPYTRLLRLYFSSCAPLYSLSQLHHVTASHPSLEVYKPPERGRVVRRNAVTTQNGRVKLNHLHMHQGSPLVSINRASSRSLLRHPFVAQGHRPSNPTLVCSVPALDLLPPSSPFYPSGPHPFSPRVELSQYSCDRCKL